MAEDFEEEQEEPKIEEFMEIGGSPILGISLHQILPARKSYITRLAWSPDGSKIAAPSMDGTVDICQLETEETKTIKILSTIYCVSWSPDGKHIATGCHDGKVRIYDINKLDSDPLTIDAHAQKIRSIAWSPNGKLIATGSADYTVKIFDPLKSESINVLKHHVDVVTNVAWSPDGSFLISASDDNNTILCDPKTNKKLLTLIGHQARVVSLAISPNNKYIASGSADRTIIIWDLKTGDPKVVLEGHTDTVRALAFSHDSTLLASKSWDNSVRIWNTTTWETIGALIELNARDNWHAGLAFHPGKNILATLGSGPVGADTIIRIWNVEKQEIANKIIPKTSLLYTTAKVILVGDSGVGKTGLGWRLAHSEFKEHSSTHGQQFWVVPELKKTREDGTECEAVLWDLAGQHIYRSIHSIFLDDVDASLVLFDPTNRQEPLKGAQFWLEQLKGKKQLPPSVLVGARLDRGAPVLSQQELDQFCQKYGISGGYIGTSAKSGEGMDNLLETIKGQIPWDQMTTTVTTVTFKRIKEYVLSLKEKTDRKGVLVHPEELREQLQSADKDWEFSDAEMMTAVGHLANHGYVSILHNSSGEEYVLLVPELLASVASSIFLHADKHPRELGAINETALLQGEYLIDEFKGLEKEEQHVLLDATVVRFLEHSLCFRETLGNDNLLIFPNLIKQKRPLQDEFESIDSVSYILRGRVENIYASLVVLLGYTSMFTRINQWQNQAQYEMGKDEICGFRLIEEREGELELVLYYGAIMPPYGRTMFQGLFESFLYKRDVDITRFPPVHCPQNHLLQRSAVIKRVLEGKNFMFCDECGEKTILPEIEKPSGFKREESRKIRRSEATAQLRRTYETYLVRVKGFRRDRSAPRCYVSYVKEDSVWSEQFIQDLREAGVQIIEESRNVKIDDVILYVDTPEYRSKPIEADMALGKARIDQGLKPSMLRLRVQKQPDLDGKREPELGNFQPESRYAVGLFNTLLELYAIPPEHPAFKQLRESLQQQWEQSLANMNNGEFYISYAWGGESEKIVDELDKAFQTQDVIIVRDKRDLGYKGRIKEFMQTIGQGKAVILVISEKYLKSENCMFELLQVAKNGEFTDRIFPIVLEDARIYKAIDRIRYVEHWEKQLKELDNAMKGVSAANMDGFREDIDLYDEIRDNLPKLSDILKDMNTLTPELHRQSGFKEVINAVMAKLEE